MPPEHYLVLLRLVYFVNVGGVAMREIYDFMDDPWVTAVTLSSRPPHPSILMSLDSFNREKKSTSGWLCFLNYNSSIFSQQEVPQKAGPAGVAGVSNHSHRVPHSGQVWPQNHHAAHPLLRHAVLVFRNLPHIHLDSVAVLHPVRSGMWRGGKYWQIKTIKVFENIVLEIRKKSQEITCITIISFLETDFKLWPLEAH